MRPPRNDASRSSQWVRLVGIDLGALGDPSFGQRNAFRLTLGNVGDGPATALRMTMTTRRSPVWYSRRRRSLRSSFRSQAEPSRRSRRRRSRLHRPGGALRLKGQRLAQLVGQHEGGLVGHIESRPSCSADNPSRVHEDRDTGAEVRERQLAAGEDGARRDGELRAAVGALEAAAGRDE